MNELITYSVEDGTMRYIGEMPRELLFDEELDIFTGIGQYFRKHGRMPSLKSLVEKFPGFLPFMFSPTPLEPERPPLSEVYDRAIRNRLRYISDRRLRAALSDLNETGELDLEIISELKRLHTLSLGVHRYSTIDRSAYFRRHGVDIPFKILNRAMGGMSMGDYLIFVGKLGTGKSTMIQYLTKSFWEQGKRVLFISAEMAPLDVFARIDAMVGEFNPLRLREGRTPEMEATLRHVTGKAEDCEGEIIIPTERLLTPDQIGAFADNMQIDMIFIDGVYLLRPSGTTRYSSNWETVKQVSNEIQQMALNLQVPVVGTAQLAKSASGDTFDTDQIAYSNALAQDAAFVVAIKQSSVVEGEFELQLIKNRYGNEVTTLASVNYDKMEVVDVAAEPAKEISFEEL